MEMCNKQGNVLQQAGSPITWIRLPNSMMISFSFLNPIFFST